MRHRKHRVHSIQYKPTFRIEFLIIVLLQVDAGRMNNNDKIVFANTYNIERNGCRPSSVHRHPSPTHCLSTLIHSHGLRCLSRGCFGVCRKTNITHSTECLSELVFQWFGTWRERVWARIMQPKRPKRGERVALSIRRYMLCEMFHSTAM